jgi:two-component system, OmpR family, heavy metal sensor histidine kinase CusS
LKRLSLRVRLTVWYLAVLAPAMMALAIGGWWLVRRSLIAAADANLAGKIEGVRHFVENAEREALTPEGLRDEFLEFAQLTSGDTFLEVTGADGEIFCRPALTGWITLSSLANAGHTRVSPDQIIGTQPFRVATGVVPARDNRYHVLVAVPMEQTFEALRRFRWALLLLMPSVVVAAGAGAYWITGRALAPVDRMTQDVQAITVHSLERRLNVPVSDVELQRLAATFNEMLSRLQAAVSDISQLTADASHELRTPVTLVRATADVALTRERSPAEYREALQDVLTHAERMSALVDDLLALARVDAGVEPRESASTDLVDVARTAAADVRAAVTRAGVNLDLEVPDAPVPVAATSESLRRLLLILLANAIRYTPSGGRITIRLEPGQAARPGAAALHVIDTGIGIDPAERPHVFDRFYRGAAARAIAADGSGLGLAIAKAIVSRLGGTIAVGATPPGGGCHIQVRFQAG